MWLFWCIYLVTENIAVAAGNNTDVTFKNCTPFSTCKTVINDVFVDKAEHIYTAMPMYNLIEYSDNYSDTSGSLWQFKKDDVPANNANLTNTDADAANNNTNSSVKKHKNSCFIKLFK